MTSAIPMQCSKNVAKLFIPLYPGKSVGFVRAVEIFPEKLNLFSTGKCLSHEDWKLNILTLSSCVMFTVAYSSKMRE